MKETDILEYIDDPEEREYITEARKILDQIDEQSRSSKGTVVVDEHLFKVGELLKQKGMKVIFVDKGTDDTILQEKVLPNRIFITNNTKHFIWEASTYGYCIIATEGVSSDPVELSNIINKAFIKMNLWSRKNWICKLRSSGKHVLEGLPG